MASMLALSPTAPAKTVAQVTKQQGLPGRASERTIRNKRRARAGRQPSRQQQQGSHARLLERLTAEATAEVARRGGETVIQEERRDVPLSVIDRDPQQRIVLVKAAGWRQYSRQFGARRAAVTYLYGRDDRGSGPWAVRVPSTCTTVAQALAALVPKSVIEAEQSGRRVRRQGDVYAVETTRAHDGTGSALLPDSHVWDTVTRRLKHRPERGGKHRSLALPWPVRFVRQSALEMGRGASRADGD